MNSRSALFCVLSEDQLRACTDRYFGEPLLGWELLQGGLFNTTYRLVLPGRRVILRLGPVNRHLLLPYEQGLMACEPAVQNLLLDRGIKTSRTVALDLTRTFLDRDIAIVEEIPGFNMTSVELSREAEADICLEAGTIAKQIHGVTAFDLPEPPEKPFGRTSAVLRGEGSASWKEAMLRELDQWKSCASSCCTFSEQEISRFCGCFVSFSDAFDAVKTPSLVHGDLWYGNILLDDNKRIAAIIDADRSYFGDPEFDLMLPWMLREPFLQGYGAKASEEAALRRELYRLLLCLEDCYILQMEYRNPEGFLQAKDTALRHLLALEEKM